MKKLDDYPDFLSIKDLVNLGIFPTRAAADDSKIRGNFPCYLKIGKKVLIAKIDLVSWLEKNKVFVRKSNG